MALSRDEILARKVHGKTITVTLPVAGGEVVVRGLSRGEARIAGALDDQAEVENTALRFGLIEPALNLDDVETWCEQAASGDVQAVVDAIQDLSGTSPGQAKEYTKSVSRGRRAAK
jgi:hypothetical protein